MIQSHFMYSVLALWLVTIKKKNAVIVSCDHHVILIRNVWPSVPSNCNHLHAHNYDDSCELWMCVYVILTIVLIHIETEIFCF